jgi:RNA-directed DNA polymerase
MEQQKQAIYQLDLFGGEPKFVGHGTGVDGGTGAAVREELQVPAAKERKRALTQDLMERVTQVHNLNKAWKRVKANKGAPGVDGMTVDELREWLVTHKEELVESLKEGSYRPQPVRGVQIPKPGEVCVNWAYQR